MSQAEKILEKMRRNPAGDWTIEDVLTVARRHGIADRQPSGSHVTLSHPALVDILTIPARKPIKAVYVKRLVNMVDSIT